MSDFLETIGENIRRHRVETLDISQEEAARRTNLRVEDYISIEEGQEVLALGWTENDIKAQLKWLQSNHSE